MNDKQIDFEQFLMIQTNALTASKPDEFNKTFVHIARLALDWFELDRLTIFPNSMILLNNAKTMSVSRHGIPELNKQRFVKDDYQEYLSLLKSNSTCQFFDLKNIDNIKLDTIKELHHEGVIWHGIIHLHLFGQAWGALSFSRFNERSRKITELDTKRMKLVSDLWLCYWQHSTMTRSLNIKNDECREDRDKLLLLSKKQCSVLSLLAQGYTAKQCAEKLFLSSRTIESHKYRMLDLLQLDNHNELIQFALRNGLGFNTES